MAAVVALIDAEKTALSAAVTADKQQQEEEERQNVQRMRDPDAEAAAAAVLGKDPWEFNGPWCSSDDPYGRSWPPSCPWQTNFDM
jgi:hypothetical protein